MTDEPAQEPVEAEATEVPSDAPDAFKPTEADLVVREPDDVYRAMDRADEVLILDEIQGRALEVFVYDFGKGNQRKVDLSVAGVKEAVRLMNERGGTAVRISPQQPVVEEIQEEGETFVKVMVYAEDMRGKSGFWGIATEPKHLKKNDGSAVLDKFAATKALNKAERNALKKHIPEEIRQTIISMARKEDRVRVLESARSAVAELPPPLTDEKAEKLKAECRRLFKELRGIAPPKYIPGRFNAMLSRAEHSHERLEDLRADLESKLEAEKAEANG